MKYPRYSRGKIASFYKKKTFKMKTKQFYTQSVVVSQSKISLAQQRLKEMRKRPSPVS
jgi:hypothetical protein